MPADPAPRPWWRRHGAFLVATAGAVLTTGFVIWPVLGSAYTSDDIVLSQIPMRMRAEHLSWWEFVRTETQGWIDSVGRLFPASVAETALIFVTFPSRAAYKAYQFAVVIVDAVLFAWLVWRLSADRWLGLLAALFVAAGLQFRFFHDAILQFNGQQQILLGCVLGALLLTHSALKRGHRRLLVPAALLWTVALLTYETAYLIVPAFALVAWHAGGSRRLRAAAVAVAVGPALLFGGITLYLRSQVTVTHGAYTTDLSPTKVAPTLVKQAAASLPLVYSAFNVPPQPPDVPDRVEPWARAWDLALPLDALMIVVTGAAVTLAARTVRLPDRRTTIVLAGIAVLIWLPPALLMAATPRWQMQLRLGNGYITAYAGAFGVALLLALGGAWLLERTRRRQVGAALASGLLAGLVVFATQATADNNDRVVHMFSGHRVMREAFERAVERGIFDGVADGASVASPPVGWVTAPLIAWYGGPEELVIGDTGDWTIEHGWTLARAGRPDPPPSAGGAWVVVARVDDSTTGEIRVYLEDDRLPEASIGLTVAGTPVEPGDVHVVDRGERWALLRVQPTAEPLPTGDVGVVFGTRLSKHDG